MTKGIISGLNRRVDDQTTIQVDVCLSSGNSGGVLLDTHGRLIGIPFCVFNYDQRHGFAIPIDTGKRVITQIIETGEAEAATIGVAFFDENMEELVTASWRKVPGGPILKAVYQKSPAYHAGLKVRVDNEDSIQTIVAVDGQKVASLADFYAIMDTVFPGAVVTVTLVESN
jgi:S1-C subfamily serine protease